MACVDAPPVLGLPNMLPVPHRLSRRPRRKRSALYGCPVTECRQPSKTHHPYRAGKEFQGCWKMAINRDPEQIVTFAAAPISKISASRLLSAASPKAERLETFHFLGDQKVYNLLLHRNLGRILSTKGISLGEQASSRKASKKAKDPISCKNAA